MQAKGVFDFGEPLTKYYGNLHEENGNRDYGQPYGEENMDKWNNAVGLELGNSLKKELKDIKDFYNDRQIKDIIAVKVMEKIKNGELITSPDDKRLYETSRFNNRFYTMDDINNMDKDEYKIHEHGIKTQLSNGDPFPNPDEAQDMVLKGHLIYVQPRKLDDGREIKGYFKKKSQL